MAATANLSRLRYVPEAQFGVTPSTANTSKDLRFTGESLAYALSTETSQEIRSDRQIADLIQTGAEAAGDIQFELSFGTYDEFIAAALGGTWVTTNAISPPNMAGFTATAAGTQTTDQRDVDLTGVTVTDEVTYIIKIDGQEFRFVADSSDTATTIAAGLAALINADPQYSATNSTNTVEITDGAGLADIVVDAEGVESYSTLVNGVTVPFFSIEKGFTDVNQFILFRGMAVNTMSLDFAVGSILTGSFGFIGKDSINDQTSGVPGLAPAGAMTEVMNAVTNFADLSIGGVAYPCGISNLSFATDAGLRAQNSIGNLGACAIVPGTFTPTGSFSVYFDDATLYSNYIANSSFALTWKVRDAAGNEYEFTMPRVKITNATVMAGGLDTDVSLDADYQALYDSSAGHTIKVVRTPA